MKFLLVGKKLGMTQYFGDSGELLGVTAIKVYPSEVSQVKTEGRDGYNAVQVASYPVKEKNITSPVMGHLKKAGLGPNKIIKEFRPASISDYSVGQSLGVDSLSSGQKIDIWGNSTGKGFQGVVKRYGFKKQPRTHGSMAHRRPGSIGRCQWPGRVDKNKKMPGRMGCVRCTVQNLTVVKVIEDQGVILVKGSVPGKTDGFLFIRNSKKMS